MIILADIVVSLLLIVIGYIAICYYFHDKKWNSKDITSLKLNKNKTIYLMTEICSIVLLIAVFRICYDLEALAEIKLLVLVLSIFPIAAVDYKIQKIPNRFLATALCFRGLLYIPETLNSPRNALSIFIDNFLGAIIVSVFFLLLLLVFRNSIGMGDVKLFFVMGMYQGLWGVINSVFFSLVVSFFVSVALLMARRKKKTDTIALGPNILVGTMIAICLAGM